MRSIPQDAWTEEEIEYAGRINATVPDIWKDSVRFSGAQDKNTHIYSGVMPIDTQDDYGSTDVGDVDILYRPLFIRRPATILPHRDIAGRWLPVWEIPSGLRACFSGPRVTALAVLRLLTSRISYIKQK